MDPGPIAASREGDELVDLSPKPPPEPPQEPEVRDEEPQTSPGSSGMGMGVQPWAGEDDGPLDRGNPSHLILRYLLLEQAAEAVREEGGPPGMMRHLNKEMTQVLQALELGKGFASQNALPRTEQPYELSGRYNQPLSYMDWVDAPLERRGPPPDPVDPLFSADEVRADMQRVPFTDMLRMAVEYLIGNRDADDALPGRAR